MKIKMIILFLVVVLIVIVVSFFVYKKYLNNTNKCVPLSGGSFHVNYVVNGGEELSSMVVGVACSPDSYEDLKVPVREGYTFDGWYYDKELTKKIEFTNSIDFKPIPKYDDNKCQIGFEDIEIYAKWKK